MLQPLNIADMTLEEIAENHRVPLERLTTWTRHPEWPPAGERDGTPVYDPAAVAAWMTTYAQLVTVAEISQRYGRTLGSVRQNWTARRDWPAAHGKRGRYKTYWLGDVDLWYREHIARPPTPDQGRPDDLLTLREAAEYAGVAYGTFRAYRSRGTFPKQDAVSPEGVPQWRRDTIRRFLETRTRR